MFKILIVASFLFIGDGYDVPKDIPELSDLLLELEESLKDFERNLEELERGVNELRRELEEIEVLLKMGDLYWDYQDL